MLAANKYKKAYIDAARRHIDAQLAAYKKIAGTTRNAAATSFEQQFCKHMILALDRYFVHRTRGAEGKDGNPLNEVRMLCTSITEGGDTLRADTTIKYDPAKSTLKLKIGDKIDLTVDQFAMLAAAFFKELAAKFS